MKCDVLVVGASAAGMMAAISAARCGSDVILLDRNPWGVDHSANTFFNGMASQTGFQVDDCYIKRSLRGMRIISPSGYCATIPAEGYFIDRRRFDDHYLNIAEKEGVMLVEGKASGILIRSGNSRISTQQGDIQAKVTIDASGVQPALARQAGFSPIRHPQDIAWAMEATVQHPGLGEEDFFEYWIGSMAPGWKATFSPAGEDLATLGVFVRGHGMNVNHFFQSFLGRFKTYKAGAYRKIEEMKILSIKQGGDPIAVIPGEIVSDSFMVTGGAAGQSGLIYGMRAGSICGTVAGESVSAGEVSKASLSRYERLWRSEFGRIYRLGRASLETLRNMSDRDIDELVRGISGKELILRGSLWRKALDAGIKTTRVQPKAVLNLVINIAKG
ncbi:MAG: NAD(P)/FAD-dependent oxidoreductase [Methanotrichaceae archaeon]|jgi:digeranylgeranylglycerophospholipid reductase